MKDNLLDELRWCYADGNSGPRTKAALKAAIRELERAKPAGEAEQIGPTKAYCRTCKEVTPCEWRWNSDTCADLCCNVCHDIHVCVHEFSDCDSQRLGALARAVMHDHVYRDTLQARVEELEAQLAAPPAAANQAGMWQPIETAPKGCEIWAFNGEQARMQWSEGDADNGEGWALWVWADQLLSDADPEPDQPTHWMALPAAPHTEPQKE